MKKKKLSFLPSLLQNLVFFINLFIDIEITKKFYAYCVENFGRQKIRYPNALMPPKNNCFII